MMHGMGGGCPVAHVFQGLSGLAYAFTNSSGRGLGAMFNSTPSGCGAMFNGLAGLFRRVLIVLS
jgi:hypothetical protein